MEQRERIIVFYDDAYYYQGPNFGVNLKNGKPELWMDVPERISTVYRGLLSLPFIVQRKLHDLQLPDEHWVKAVHDSSFVDYMIDLASKLNDGEYRNSEKFTLPGLRDTPISKYGIKASLDGISIGFQALDYIQNGERFVYVITRPPGHHAGKDFFGGYCFFNKVGVLANRLALDGRIGILDCDFHHGNGTQNIFYDRDDVVYASIHCDTKYVYPYYGGGGQDRGGSRGKGFNLNFPLLPHATQKEYFGCLDHSLEFLDKKGVQCIIVSLGYDIHSEDPHGGFDFKDQIFFDLGQRIAQTGKPLLICQEGGYFLKSLSKCATSFCSGLLS